VGNRIACLIGRWHVIQYVQRNRFMGLGTRLLAKGVRTYCGFVKLTLLDGSNAGLRAVVSGS
jgi:hypothetical protein